VAVGVIEDNEFTCTLHITIRRLLVIDNVPEVEVENERPMNRVAKVEAIELKLIELKVTEITELKVTEITELKVTKLTELKVTELKVTEVEVPSERKVRVGARAEAQAEATAEKGVEKIVEKITDKIAEKIVVKRDSQMHWRHQQNRTKNQKKKWCCCLRMCVSPFKKI
jgi:hypothetical protein